MQLHFYVSDELGADIRRRAEAKGMSVSAYVAWLVAGELRDGWPDGYFETVVGGWMGDPLQRPAQGRLEERERL